MKKNNKKLLFWLFIFGLLILGMVFIPKTTEKYLDNTLPDKNNTPVFICNQNNIPPKWPFSDYNFDGVSIKTINLRIESGEPKPDNEWSVSISKTGDQLLWIAGFVPGTVTYLQFNDLIASKHIADENGFIYPTNNVPLPTCALPYQNIRVVFPSTRIQNGIEQINKEDSGVQSISYNVSTDKNITCESLSNIYGVYAIVSNDKRKELVSNPIKVVFPAWIFYPKIYENGKITQKIEKTTRTYIVNNGILNIKI